MPKVRTTTDSLTEAEPDTQADATTPAPADPARQFRYFALAILLTVFTVAALLSNATSIAGFFMCICMMLVVFFLGGLTVFGNTRDFLAYLKPFSKEKYERELARRKAARARRTAPPPASPHRSSPKVITADSAPSAPAETNGPVAPATRPAPKVTSAPRRVAPRPVPPARTLPSQPAAEDTAASATDNDEGGLQGLMAAAGEPEEKAKKPAPRTVRPARPARPARTPRSASAVLQKLSAPFQ